MVYTEPGLYVETVTRPRRSKHVSRPSRDRDVRDRDYNPAQDKSTLSNKSTPLNKGQGHLFWYQSISHISWRKYPNRFKRRKSAIHSAPNGCDLEIDDKTCTISPVTNSLDFRLSNLLERIQSACSAALLQQRCTTTQLLSASK